MVHRTMLGKEIDFEKLVRQNELTPAVGNMRVNARGDELGAGGKIIKKREEVVQEYYENNPKATPKQVQAQTRDPVKPEEKPAVSKNKKNSTEE